MNFACLCKSSAYVSPLKKKPQPDWGSFLSRNCLKLLVCTSPDDQILNTGSVFDSNDIACVICNLWIRLHFHREVWFLCHNLWSSAVFERPKAPNIAFRTLWEKLRYIWRPWQHPWCTTVGSFQKGIRHFQWLAWSIWQRSFKYGFMCSAVIWLTLSYDCIHPFRE